MTVIGWFVGAGDIGGASVGVAVLGMAVLGMAVLGMAVVRTAVGTAVVEDGGVVPFGAIVGTTVPPFAGCKLIAASKRRLRKE